MGNRIKYDDIIESNKKVLVKLHDIECSLEEHDKLSIIQFLQAMGITVMALSAAFLISVTTPDSNRFLISGFLLLFTGIILVYFAYPIAKLIKKIDKKSKLKKEGGKK